MIWNDIILYHSIPLFKNKGRGNVATCENVLNDWKVTENALCEQGLLKEAEQVLAFIQKLPPVKTDHDLLKEKMLADHVRPQSVLVMKTPTFLLKLLRKAMT